MQADRTCNEAVIFWILVEICTHLYYSKSLRSKGLYA
jgi:hypothetical protein